MIREAIETVVSGADLGMEESAAAMREIMDGEATTAQISAFVTALRIKGETAEEVAGMATVMRDKALPLDVDGPLVDTCGTGGDGKGTFNVSTAAAFAAAAAGLRVAKHGNRAASGTCGSADVLEALGVKIDLGPAGVKRCIMDVGIGFMFAPTFHPAMRHAAPVRREIGIRTAFNILGPLTNPARAQRQLVGVADPDLGEKVARVLDLMGSQGALVVHGDDGLDEVSLGSTNHAWELKDGSVTSLLLFSRGPGTAPGDHRPDLGRDQGGQRSHTPQRVPRRARSDQRRRSGECRGGPDGGRRGRYPEGGSGPGRKGHRRWRGTP